MSMSSRLLGVRSSIHINDSSGRAEKNTRRECDLVSAGRISEGVGYSRMLVKWTRSVYPAKRSAGAYDCASDDKSVYFEQRHPAGTGEASEARDW